MSSALSASRYINEKCNEVAPFAIYPREKEIIKLKELVQSVGGGLFLFY